MRSAAARCAASSSSADLPVPGAPDTVTTPPPVECAPSSSLPTSSSWASRSCSCRLVAFTNPWMEGPVTSMGPSLRIGRVNEIPGESVPRRLSVRLGADPAEMAGTISQRGMPDREFAGWLELLSILEGWRRAVLERSGEDDQQQHRENREADADETRTRRPVLRAE